MQNQMSDPARFRKGNVIQVRWRKKYRSTF